MRFTLLAAIALSGAASAMSAAPLTTPFEFDRGELAFRASIAGQPVLVLLDTGVDPSGLDLATADQLHLPVRRNAGGEASGEGGGASALAYPATIVGLSIGNRSYPPFAAAASDMSGMSRGYGRPLQAVLGYSFLHRQPVLVNYVGHTLSFLRRGEEARALTSSCKVRFEQPLRLLTGLHWPVISGFRIGNTSAPVSLDTGSNAGVALYQSALSMPGVRAALKEAGTVEHGGFRGNAVISTYKLGTTIGFGPFNLPPGQAVTVREDVGSTKTRVANVGNQVFAAMKLKMLLDYPGRRIVFWSGCADRG